MSEWINVEDIKNMTKNDRLRDEVLRLIEAGTIPVLEKDE